MRNEEVVAMLEETADLMEIAGENPFKARAYRRAADAIAALKEPVEELVRTKRLNQIEGVGESIARDITEFLQKGTTTRLEQLRQKYPPQLRKLLEIQGVGPRTVAMLFERLGIVTVDELEAAAKAGKLTKLPGMGEQKVRNILEGIQLWRQQQGRVPLHIALAIAERIVARLRELPQVEQILPAGSLRRWKETVGDLDILVATRDSEPVMERFVKLPEVQKVLAHGTTKSSVLMANNLQVDLRAVDPESFGAASQYFTGSKAHNIALRNRALKLGLTINEYGVFREATGEKVAGETEEGVYEVVGLLWIPPELREDRGELEAAERRALPRLVTLEDIRGELHCHTKWSDGANTVEEMARAARERGYEYLAITDHSPPMGWGVKPENFRKLIREIRQVSERLGFPILAGIEVDIAPDGSLHMGRRHPAAIGHRDCVGAFGDEDEPRRDDEAHRQSDGEPAGAHPRSPDGSAHQSTPALRGGLGSVGGKSATDRCGIGNQRVARTVGLERRKRPLCERSRGAVEFGHGCPPRRPLGLHALCRRRRPTGLVRTRQHPEHPLLRATAGLAEGATPLKRVCALKVAPFRRSNRKGRRRKSDAFHLPQPIAFSTVGW
jgi:DNA polymerase (family X)